MNSKKLALRIKSDRNVYIFKVLVSGGSFEAGNALPEAALRDGGP